MPRPLKIWRNVFRRRAVEEDLDQELRAYVDLLAGEKVKAGVPPQDARRAALIELGGIEQTKESVRGVKAGALLWQLGTDLLHGFRIIRRNPGFAAVAIVSLALGIGVNSTVFSSLSALVLHPFPFPHVDRVMTAWEISSKSNEKEAVSPANFLDWKKESTSFEAMAASRPLDVTWTRSGEPERILSQLVTDDFFQVLGTSARTGRTFLKDEMHPGRDGVVVLSHAFWKTRLASASNAIGQTLILGQKSYSIVGIMPETFNYPLETDVWVPLAMTPIEQNERGTRELEVIGRLRAGITQASASVELQGIARRLAARYPKTNDGRGVRITTLLDAVDPMTARFTLVLLAAAQFVLLLACANVANLLLARATARQKEIAVRSALGAGRARIARQLLAEVAVLGLAAGVLGVLLGAWNLETFRAAVPPQVYHFLPGVRLMRMDRGSALLGLGLSILSALLCSVPALYQLLGRSLSAHPGETLKEGGRSGGGSATRSRVRSAIVIAESALALLLLAGAGLMVNTFRHMLAIEKGFDPAHVLTMQVAIPESRYQEPDQVRAFYGRVLDGFANLPAAQSAAASAELPSRSIRVEGHAPALVGEPETQLRAITPAYFESLKIPLLEGRAFRVSDDRDSPPVVIVSQSVAQRHWPQGSALGHSIQLGTDPAWYTVVGVAGDIKDWFSQDPRTAVYRSFAQAPQRAAELLLRTQGDPLGSSDSARRTVYRVDANQPVFEVDSMENAIANETSGVGAAARMMAQYALIALLLAPAGIYSLSSYLMAQRTHEIGIRMALGAGRESILKLSLMQSARLAGTGLAIGLVAAIGLGRLMSSVLLNAIVLDWTTFADVTLLLAACAFLAGYLPARRASRVDPVTALRHE